MRTSSPDPVHAPGVQGMEYSGAFPVSRLTLMDPAFAGVVDVDVIAHGAINPQQSSAGGMAGSKISMTPAVAFSLKVRNLMSTPINASFLLTLPLAMQPETERVGSVVAATTTSDAHACKQACDSNDACHSWAWTEANMLCRQQNNIPLNFYSSGVVSGIKGSWTLVSLLIWSFF